MLLSQKSLEKLRLLINEETEYRSGPEIIKFFSNFDYQDQYQQGFPSRWIYTDSRLNNINSTGKIKICIQQLFSPVNFINDFEKLDALISEFNQYLQFDKYKVLRSNTKIEIQQLQNIDLDTQIKNSKISAYDFITHEFKVDIEKLSINHSLSTVINARIIEIEKAFRAEAYLSVVILAGSTLEGLLLNCASLYPKQFNTCNSTPKRDAKAKNFDQWTLNNFIDVAHELNLIEHDTYKFSKELRDFRNYIHPFQQMTENFHPREETAKICLQVLKATIADISKNELTI